jgi:hypothetical protein
MGILFSKQPEVGSKPLDQNAQESAVQETTVPQTIPSETTVSPPIVTEPVVVEPTATNVVETPTNENLDPKTPDLFERAVESPGNKVEVVPVNVNPGADVVKKTNKKKIKKSKTA